MNRIIVYSAVVLLEALLLECAPRSRCIWGDMRVPVGFTWRSADGCGRCECKPGGIISCPDNPRCEDESNVLECQYGESYIRVGQQIEHTDGCNRCTCQLGGQLTCTSKPCHCPHQGGLLAIGAIVRANDSCNTCQCTHEGALLCTEYVCEPEVCMFRNRTYSKGEEFPRGDGCNNCTCGAERRITCTEARCIAHKCIYDGKIYPALMEFPKGDGCNHCFCDIDGEISCSTIKCPPTIERVLTNNEKNRSCKHGDLFFKVGEKYSLTMGGEESSCKTCTCKMRKDGKQQEVAWDCAVVQCVPDDPKVNDATTRSGGVDSSMFPKGWPSLTVASLVTWVSSWFQ